MPFDAREGPEEKGLSFFRRKGEEERPQPAPGLAVGKVVGDFRLVSLIGQGGMGQVWEAEQVSLRRRVAVKFVRPERVTAHQLELFAREARAGGRLNHPGIVSVFGHGESDGLAWIAMELVSGAWTLKDFLDDAARAPEVPEGYDRHVARFVAEIADAMQAAHEAAVIHRDLKPQNVLITSEDRPKVTDFGLARITDESALSVTGDFTRTYFYMSPEQVAAKRAGIDHRTDVFSLGIVLYELLALRRPFEGDTSHQVAAQILAKDPPDIRTVRSRVPRDLAVIAGKALEKDRDKRFPTMKELAADLRRHLANEPIHARPPTRLERVVKWAKRNPGKSSAAAIVAVTFTVIALLLAANVRTNRALSAERTNLANANLALRAKTAEAEESARAARDNARTAQANEQRALAAWRALADARSLGDYRLALALVHPDSSPADQEELPSTLREGLLRQEESFPIVARPDDADWWLVLAPGGRVWLRPGPREGGFDVFGVAAEEIVERLTAIQKTRNLRRFAGSSFTAEWRDELDVWVERKTARGGWQRLERDAVLHPGERIKVLMQKKTDAIYDVNVFYLDANYGAVCLRPSPRLAPTAREAIDLTGEQTITDDALGLENVLVFATPRTEASREVQLCPLVEPPRGLSRGGPSDPFEERFREMLRGEYTRGEARAMSGVSGTQSLLLTLRTEWGELAPPPWPKEIALVERPERAPHDRKEAPAHPAGASALELSDPWDFGARAALVRSSKNGPFDLLLLGNTEVEVVLVDFDPPAAPPTADTAELVRSRGFDAEAAFYFGARRIAWYDRADRGVFDLALEDANADGVAETRWTRTDDAPWQREDRVALPWLSQAYVAPGKLRNSQEKIAVLARLQALQRLP